MSGESFHPRLQGRREVCTTEMGQRQFRLFEPRQVDAMIAGSEIQDGCTLAAYHKYKAVVQPDNLP